MPEKERLDYLIKECDECFLVENAETFAALCRKSFQEHAEKGVNFGPISMTAERFAQRAVGNIGQYVVLDGKIIAFWNAKPDYDTKIVHGDILAVDPEYKGHHIGLALSLSLAEMLKSQGFHLFITDTSLKAPHVVAFHKRYGCKAIGMRHFWKRNYRSVILRLALSPEYEISDLHADLLYFYSGLKCKSLTRSNGEPTLLAKFLNILSSKNQ